MLLDLPGMDGTGGAFRAASVGLGLAGGKPGFGGSGMLAVV